MVFASYLKPRTLRVGIAVRLPWLAAIEFEKWIRFGRNISIRHD
jgi:hypothetical protein